MTCNQGEVEHRRSKTARYLHTNKKNFEVQLAGMDLRDARFREMEFHESRLQQETSQTPPLVETDQPTVPDEHHFVIAESQKRYIVLPQWLSTHRADSALKVSASLL